MLEAKERERRSRMTRSAVVIVGWERWLGRACVVLHQEGVSHVSCDVYRSIILFTLLVISRLSSSGSFLTLCIPFVSQSARPEPSTARKHLSCKHPLHSWLCFLVSGSVKTSGPKIETVCSSETLAPTSRKNFVVVKNLRSHILCVSSKVVWSFQTDNQMHFYIFCSCLHFPSIFESIDINLLVDFVTISRNRALRPSSSLVRLFATLIDLTIREACRWVQKVAPRLPPQKSSLCAPRNDGWGRGVPIGGFILYLINKLRNW